MSPQRRGFSLIELIVVIAIITILAALLLAGVQAVLKQRPEIANRNDISQLNIALQNFKAKFGFYPPSRIKLCVYRSDYDTTQQLDIDSINYLTRMFPNMGWASVQNPAPMAWNGVPSGASGISAANVIPNKQLNKSLNGTVLEGDQCLVFFLGGIPQPAQNGNPPGVQGFSTNPLDPTDVPSVHASAYPGQPQPGVIGPFLTFAAGRVTPRDFGYNTVTKATTPGYVSAHNYGFLSYFDAYSKPYLYFSANNRKNGYNTADIIWAGHVTGITSPDAYPVGPVYMADNGTTTTPALAFANPDTFQILGAGRDTVYGQGCAPMVVNTPGTANPWQRNGSYESGQMRFDSVTNPNPPGGNGQDDMSNFYDSPLGVAQ